ncbi:AAA family ATPase [Fusobacterium polymorphum]|uniref:9-O-acetyl-N-acetylneuraminate esterase n=1 Tax=Fusobacterium nucleatum subsp. polymorphum TaxID=76857 RepID=A0A2C6B0J0_FUSNP|nr:AAA family ATPase [Fusobacterium polymorphum]PHH99107.1 9-O-acetyl-N-acetylneuraminate esterase [Fusobacterium polymorphum]PIM76053.1 9-O-acetyl-N-acetylneuraminate esterase [Fusobacterium polymorphum]
MKKGIGIGIEDFKKIIEEDCYYFDKTNYIEELLKDRTEIKLFTRPRRFGKTLNMTTLKYFFDVKNAEENRKLFKDLYIEKSEYFKEQGQYPIIFITMKDLKKNTWEQMYFAAKSLISNLYNEFEFIREKLNEKDLIEFEKIWFKKEDGDYDNSLRLLSEYLYNYYQKKVVLLIDEYDNPLIVANQNGYYKEAINFYRNLYSSALKTNSNLKMGVLTGIVQVAKEGIFSGLNNVITYNILGNDFETFFGLSEEEVENSLKYFELEYEIEEVKKWYDGYKFGNSEVYNPWSIINYLRTKELQAYWVNTSDNALIYDSLKNSTVDVFNNLQTLFEGKEIKKEISPFFTFEELSKFDGIWQLMVYNGYLKINEKLSNDEYMVKIPNYEIQTFFKKGFIDKFLVSGNYFNPMMDALLDGDIEEFERRLQNIFLVNTSFYDLKGEKVYHSLFLGMLIWLRDKYEVKSNGERGHGRYDAMLIPLDKVKPAYIFEFKVSKTIKGLTAKAEEALEQIKEKQYDAGLKEKGISKIYRIGIAFKSKNVKVKYEV